MNGKIAAILLVIIVPLSVCSAEARMGECAGTLHSEDDSLEFGGRQGESEGICVVAKSDRKKILATCSVNAFCRVKGLVTSCRDSGECTEISRIVSVTKH